MKAARAKKTPAPPVEFSSMSVIRQCSSERRYSPWRPVRVPVMLKPVSETVALLFAAGPASAPVLPCTLKTSPVDPAICRMVVTLRP